MINSKFKTLTPKSYFLTLFIIHAVLTLCVFLFTIVVFICADNVVMGFTDRKSVFIYIVPLVAMIGHFGSNYYFNKQMASMVKSISLNEKLMLYLKISVVRYAFLEGAAIMGSVSFMINNNVFYLVISLLLILYLFKLRPTRKKVMGDLSFSPEEQRCFHLEN
ncbi:hypothetical protein DHD05_11975 [Arenibacter sp. N53]|uniref:hypothetical protein n=1 Tax=Arenibacter TaxID=178469 RepID=UPI000CD45A9C|nr:MULTISPECIES: hypothetical protein [Arenibacter]MCM4152311.1 hypothetical protein [Arenibacter sp. N53]